MRTTASLTARGSAGRVAYATLAAVLIAAIAVALAKGGTGFWQLAAFGLAPDVALFYGIGANLEKGQLHPRAVPLYNLLHRYPLPVALLAFAALGVVPHGFVVGGLAWGFHISLDRAVGYGLRTRDGFQRA